jgi:uncharacterized protein (DUF2141 family)
MVLQYCKVCWRAAVAATALAVLAGLGWPRAAAAAPLACHGTPTPYRLEVTVQGIRSSRGYVVANLYGTDRRRWLADNGELGISRDPASAGEETMCLYLPAPGRYAVVVFHDANGNGNLDMGPLGPREAYGFSNNLRPILAPPLLRSALFDAGLGVTRLSIRLRYPAL